MTPLTTEEFLAKMEQARAAGRPDWYASREDQDRFSINDGKGNFLLCLKNGDVLYFCDETERYSVVGKLAQASPAQQRLLLMLAKSHSERVGGEMRESIRQMAFELWHPTQRVDRVSILFKLGSDNSHAMAQIVVDGAYLGDAKMDYSTALTLIEASRGHWPQIFATETDPDDGIFHTEVAAIRQGRELRNRRSETP